MTERSEKKSSLYELCSFISGKRFDELPGETVEHTKLVIMDTLGVILRGSRDAHLERLGNLFATSEDQKVSTRLGHRERLSSMSAALLNGAAGSTRELEEGNAKALGHPGIQLIPAALSHAESVGAGGKRFLEGVILGYEMAARSKGVWMTAKEENLIPILFHNWNRNL